MLQLQRILRAAKYSELYEPRRTETNHLPLPTQTLANFLLTHDFMPGSQSNKHSLPPLVRIMVVEPDSDMKSLLYDFLSSLGLQVQAFSSATEALGALRTARDLTLSNPHERYSFLLMQTHLRDFLPHRFFIEAKALFPELFVILTSTGSRTTLDHLRKSWGANASLLQPIALDELEKIVKTKFV